LPDPFGSQMNQGKTIVYFFQTIFNGNPSHNSSPYKSNK
jgi:hypothetical protein